MDDGTPPYPRAPSSRYSSYPGSWAAGSDASVDQPHYDASLAEATEKREREMSFTEAVQADKRLILYSLGFSGTIVMEGYGLVMITYLFTLPVFNETFGQFDADTQTYEISYQWRVLLPLVALMGAIVGVALASPITNRLGYKRATQILLLCSGGLVFLPFFAATVEILLAGFLLQSIPWGAYQVISPAYSSELASLQLRPILTTWNNLCWVLGQLLASGVAKGLEGAHSALSYKVPFGTQEGSPTRVGRPGASSAEGVPTASTRRWR
ncbi:hypothetical protein VTK73DRAFT_2352 [Phialemonium thermophilum]|uniref:Major facilitator superfamily (MFS) profile domain-containing protein n=1 Tax=Phialemonium thermophilum TaxID=223376 RepID=A0ABR3VSA5_9PEZI